jgi:hypothetical protein
MPSKKATRVRAPGPLRAKRKIGVMSALGPKVITVLVLVVLAGGLMLAAHERRASKATFEGNASMAADSASASASPAPAKTTPPVSDAGNAAREATVPTVQAPVTTIAGCLERDGDAFRLKDTSGADAPKTRSWKSGFIKKSTSSVDVFDRSKALGLSSRIGQRVSVTGTLVDRALQARSVRRIASSCN